MSESERLYRWDIAPEQFGVVIKHSLNNTATYYGPGHDIEIPVDIADEILSLASELESLRQELARKDEALKLAFKSGKRWDEATVCTRTKLTTLEQSLKTTPTRPATFVERFCERTKRTKRAD